MKIKIDKECRKFFKNTGTHIVEYQLFICNIDDSIEWTKEYLPIVLDDSKVYYLIKKYGEDRCGIVEIRRTKTEWGLAPVLNSADISICNSEYHSKTGIRITLYGTFSEKFCKNRIMKKLKEYIDKHRWVLDIKMENVIKAME